MDNYYITPFLNHLYTLTEEKQTFTLNHLPTHLAKQGDQTRLQHLLTTFDFLQAKTDAIGIQALIEDYNPIADNNFRQIQAILRLSAHVPAEDSTQLAGQLSGRATQAPPVQTLLRQARPAFPWLQPLTASLTAAGSFIVRTFSGHTTPVTAAPLTAPAAHLSGFS